MKNKSEKERIFAKFAMNAKLPNPNSKKSKDKKKKKI